MTTPLPWTVLIDTREQLPYTFTDIKADAREGGGVLTVPTVRGTLASGDYSIDGMTDRVAVERKSLMDLYGTLGSGRERFERELQRLNEMQYAAIVIEAEWTEIVKAPPERSRLKPKTVVRSILAWTLRFTRIHWWTMPGRHAAEVITFRILDRFYRDVKDGRIKDATAKNEVPLPVSGG